MATSRYCVHCRELVVSIEYTLQRKRTDVSAPPVNPVLLRDTIFFQYIADPVSPRLLSNGQINCCGRGSCPLSHLVKYAGISPIAEIDHATPIEQDTSID